jgi:hypothetical protein
MLKKISLLPLIYLLFAYVGFAQGAFKFTEEKHDFGIVEEGVQAAYEFEFVNTGNAPIVLTNVSASCGCTTPSWTKEPIAPGGKGMIKASYNSQGRPGNFTKTITVTSNATEPNKVLYIKGIVEPKTTKPVYTAQELKASPKISMEKTSYNFGKIERGQKVVTKVNVKNTGKSPLNIQSVKSACNCISYKLDKETIAPGKSAALEITYSPSYDGSNTDIATFMTNDLTNPTVTFTINSNVVESLTQKSPVMQEKTTVPFGK